MKFDERFGIEEACQACLAGLRRPEGFRCPACGHGRGWTNRRHYIEYAHATKGRILTVEDHYAHGGLGDAVLSAVGREGIRVQKMAIREIPHSGKPEELLDRYGISARVIVETVKKIA